MKERMPETETSDADLLRAYLAGSAVAFDQLVERYRQPLFLLFMGMTGNRADAEDLYQEVWMRILRNAERFKDISFRAWMWRIARNLLIDFRRRRKPVASLDAVASEDDTPWVDQLESERSGPADQLETRDLAALAMRAVEQLPEVQREVFLLRVQGELSFREIAETLEIPLNTALGRMHDAIGKLKRTLAEEA